MLFNSYEFIFAFLPLTLIAYRFLRPLGVKTQYLLLLGASWFFYAWWDVRFLPLLLVSIATNYAFGRVIASCVAGGNAKAAGHLLAAGIALNLAAIAVFKYAKFVVGNVNSVFDTDYVLGNIILPLGISFFTFEQISFLVDVRRGETKPSGIVPYALFVSFFPRLVAGPILRYNEIVPQLERGRNSPDGGNDLMVGLTIFFMGLVKKAVLADGVAPYVSPAFNAAAAGNSVDFFAAWGAALAYTCQLYFDFSGYSDMAIGIARCFGIRFPMNFFSPYKAASIIEFWRRWHITLSRFLRDYLYFGLGGNRRGPARRYVNLMLTMLLGGLWHGANWTFIFWGGLHGAYLMVNHAWINLARGRPAMERFRHSLTWHVFGSIITFIAVVVSWVFFRSPTIEGAFNLLSGMAGAHGASIPSGLAFALTPAAPVLSALRITFADGSGTQFVGTYLWVAALLSIAFLAPNTAEIMARYEPVLEMLHGSTPNIARTYQPRLLDLRWSPTRTWAAATGALAFVGIISVTRVSEFLYWQF